MNPKIFFALYSLLLIWILFSQVYMLLYYWGALLAVAIFLHTRAAYKAQHYKLTNFFMLLFTLFIVWERTRHYKLAEMPELIINDAEHILFALLICLIINFLLSLKKPPALSFTQKLLYTVIAFNITGVINEVFQNIIGHRTVFVFIPDSQKDMLMNLCGTAAFIMLSIVFKKPAKAPVSVE